MTIAVPSKTGPDEPAVRNIEHEEHWNFLTHAAGAILSCAGAAILIPNRVHDSVAVATSVALFAILLIVVFTCSALSHYFKAPRLRSLFRRLDQAFIYLLIVASYTPFSVAFQPGTWWLMVLIFMWVVAITGFVSKLFFSHRVDTVAIWIYLLLGWTPVLAGMPMAGLVPTTAIWLILVGGIFYTGGTYFLVKDYRAWYYHAVWHLCVIAGSATHFLAVKWYV